MEATEMRYIFMVVVGVVLAGELASHGPIIMSNLLAAATIIRDATPIVGMPCYVPVSATYAPGMSEVEYESVLVLASNSTIAVQLLDTYALGHDKRALCTTTPMNLWLHGNSVAKTRLTLAFGALEGIDYTRNVYRADVRAKLGATAFWIVFVLYHHKAIPMWLYTMFV
jgi:hypothetical protein